MEKISIAIILFLMTTVIYSQKPCSGIRTVNYAGKTYHTVQIGDQCWLKENLDIGKMVLNNQTPTNDGTVEKYCFDNKPENCVVYGGLYLWDEAMQYTRKDGSRGICPNGWHIPTNGEFQNLAKIVNNDANKLKDIKNGSDDNNASGFSALFGGDYISGGFGGLSSQGCFWSSSEPYNDKGYGGWMYLDSKDVIEIGGNYKNFAFSVRCVKD